MEISAKTKEHPELVTVNYDIPESLGDLVAAFGEETVVNSARGALIIGVQAFVRRHIDKSQSEIESLVAAYRPDTRQPAVKKTAAERAQSAIGQMTPEERAELLNKLKALQKAG